MSKASWGKPAYQGRPDPLKVANRIMFVIVLLLFLGFMQAGIKNEWFSSAWHSISSSMSLIF